MSTNNLSLLISQNVSKSEIIVFKVEMELKIFNEWEFLPVYFM